MKRVEVSDALLTDYQMYYDCQNVRVDLERKTSSKPLTVINKKTLCQRAKNAWKFYSPLSLWLPRDLTVAGELTSTQNTHSCRIFISIWTEKYSIHFLERAAPTGTCYQSKYKGTWLIATVKHYTDWSGTSVWLSKCLTEDY